MRNRIKCKYNKHPFQALNFLWQFGCRSNRDNCIYWSCINYWLYEEKLYFNLITIQFIASVVFLVSHTIIISSVTLDIYRITNTTLDLSFSKQTFYEIHFFFKTFCENWNFKMLFLKLTSTYYCISFKYLARWRMNLGTSVDVLLLTTTRQRNF